jgi:hypothetical protein
MTIAPPFWQSIDKIATLERAASGDLLSEGDCRLLLSIADDYRPSVYLGNNKPITVHHVLEAFAIIRSDVRFMVGDQRRRALILLAAVDARWADKIKAEHLQVNERRAEEEEKMAREVGLDEIEDAIAGVRS